MKFIKTISIIIAHYRKKEKNGRNILSAETYIELFRNTIHGNHGKHRIRNISRDAGKSTDLLWEVEHGQPASDLSAKEKRFWKVTADKAQEVCEIRLRVDRPVIIETSRGDFFWIIAESGGRNHMGHTP